MYWLDAVFSVNLTKGGRKGRKKEIRKDINKERQTNRERERERERERDARTYTEIKEIISKSYILLYQFD